LSLLVLRSGLLPSRPACGVVDLARDAQKGISARRVGRIISTVDPVLELGHWV